MIHLSNSIEIWNKDRKVCFKCFGKRKFLPDFYFKILCFDKKKF